MKKTKKVKQSIGDRTFDLVVFSDPDMVSRGLVTLFRETLLWRHTNIYLKLLKFGADIEILWFM